MIRGKTLAMAEGDYCGTSTPKGCKKISRWLASEASRTTGSSVLPLPAPRPGCQDPVLKIPVVTLVSLANHRLSSVHPFGVRDELQSAERFCRRSAAGISCTHKAANIHDPVL